MVMEQKRRDESIGKPAMDILDVCIDIDNDIPFCNIEGLPQVLALSPVTIQFGENV